MVALLLPFQGTSIFSDETVLSGSGLMSTRPGGTPRRPGSSLLSLPSLLEAGPCWDLVEADQPGPGGSCRLGLHCSLRSPGQAHWLWGHRAGLFGCPRPAFLPPSLPERAPEGCGRRLPPRMGWIPQAPPGATTSEGPDQVLQRVVRPRPHADRCPGHHVDSGAKERYLLPCGGLEFARDPRARVSRVWRRPRAASCRAVLPLSWLPAWLCWHRRFSVPTRLCALRSCRAQVCAGGWRPGVFAAALGPCQEGLCGGRQHVTRTRGRPRRRRSLSVQTG